MPKKNAPKAVKQLSGRFHAGNIRRMCRGFEPPLIEPPEWEDPEVWDNRLDWIEGSLFDIRVDSISVSRRGETAFLGVNSRKVAIQDKIEPNENGVWFLHAGMYHMASMEKLNFPQNVYGCVHPRKTLSNQNAILVTTSIGNGYSGWLDAAIYVPFGYTVEIERGARYIAIEVGVFAETDPEELDPNMGVWKDKRVTEVSGEMRGY